jgi:ankyrin repeat protein
MINSITLNVESSVTGDNLMHKVITLNNGLKKEFHRLNMIKFLYQNGVNPDKPNRENQTPLHLACKEQYFTIVEFLVSIGVDLNFKDNIGFTPFHYALMGKIELYNEAEINLNNLDYMFIPKYKFHSLGSYSKESWIMEIEIYNENIDFTDKNDLLRIDDSYKRNDNIYKNSVDIYKFSCN